MPRLLELVLVYTHTYTVYLSIDLYIYLSCGRDAYIDRFMCPSLFPEWVLNDTDRPCIDLTMLTEHCASRADGSFQYYADSH
jgi:hypothetical protein